MVIFPSFPSNSGVWPLSICQRPLRYVFVSSAKCCYLPHALLPHADFQSDEGATLRTRKFITNRLLNRKQFVVDVLHPSKANLSKDDVRTRLASLYKAPKETVQTFAFRTQFGGGKSTGFALIYDTEADLKKFEVSPLLRCVRF
jgi:small subunit ribosomal protein S24e